MSSGIYNPWLEKEKKEKTERKLKRSRDEMIYDEEEIPFSKRVKNEESDDEDEEILSYDEQVKDLEKQVENARNVLESYEDGLKKAIETNNTMDITLYKGHIKMNNEFVSKLEKELKELKQ